MRRFLTALVILVSLALALAGFASWWEAKNFFAPGPAAENTVVLIKSGTTLRGISGQLAVAGAVKNALLFRLGVERRSAASALKSGEYAIPAHASAANILDLLIRHRVVVHRITIAEGLTSATAAAMVNGDSILEGSPVAPPPEGSLLPETYLYERGTTRAELVARMQHAQSELLARLWPSRKANLPFSTEREALILASIVEKETAIPSERGQIAAVFGNRIKSGVRLESDPTIIYGLTGGVPLGHPLRQSELAKPNPYNTYQIDGLPPTPIANPGREAITAVLNPPDFDAMFFVADGSGGHAFAKTAVEHARNVARWRKIEQTRGAQ